MSVNKLEKPKLDNKIQPLTASLTKARCQLIRKYTDIKEHADPLVDAEIDRVRRNLTEADINKNGRIEGNEAATYNKLEKERAPIMGSKPLILDPRDLPPQSGFNLHKR